MGIGIVGVKIMKNSICSISVVENKQRVLVKFLGLKIKFKNPFFAEKDATLVLLEKDIIASSPYWDPLWYVQTYNHNLNRCEALDYWYRIGWKKRENPSKYINIDFCRGACGGINPIIAYHSKQICFFPDDKNNYKDENDAQRIQEYLEYKKTRNAQSVVYTCITNDYDDLKEIEIYKYVDKDWDYVCFSDNEELIKQGNLGIWEIRPLQFAKLDNTRNQRWHKIHPHILFPEYEKSVWIDGNINILTNKLYETIKNATQDILVPEHFKNLCIYTEYQDVTKLKLDDGEIINQELAFVKNDGMPVNYGFAETNVLYRNHHSEKIVNCMNMWWEFINKYSKRDQLSFTYVLWKHGIKPIDINITNTRLDIKNYYVFGHKKGRE